MIWSPASAAFRPAPALIQNPAKHLEHAAKPALAARYYEIPADALETAGRSNT